MRHYHRIKSIELFHKQEKHHVFVTWKLSIYHFQNSSKVLLELVYLLSGCYLLMPAVYLTTLTNALLSFLWKIFQTKKNTYMWYNIYGQIYLHFTSTSPSTFYLQMLLQSIWKTRIIIFKGVKFQRNKGLLVVKEREKKAMWSSFCHWNLKVY